MGSLIFLFLGLIIGGMIMVIIMSILQFNRINEYENIISKKEMM